MDFLIIPGALCLLMSMDRMMVPVWPPGAGTDTFRQVGRRSIR